MPEFEPPREFTGIRISKPNKSAGGVKAVLASMQHAVGEMGVVRSLRTLLAMNQKGGFDCQSCAWADPEGERHIAEFCENGAKALADEATLSRATPEFFREWSVADLSHKSDYWLGKRGRITHPMILRSGATHYEPCRWDEAFALIAQELNALDSPDEALFYTSGRASNEAAFLYQLFVRQTGTNNLPDCSNMCHESTGTALTEAIGIGKGTVTLEDIENAEALFIIGQNPGTNHPRMLTSLQRAKHKGCTIVSINPLPETGLMRFANPNPQEGNPLKFPFVMLGDGERLTDLYLPVRIGGDMAVLKGIMKEMLDEDERRPGQVLDRAFITEKTAGFDAFAANLRAASWHDITEESGISREQIRRAAEVFIRSNRTITCWAMGLTQHKHAVGTIQEIVNLHLMRGQIAKPGAGLCPVRGHSNVQGDRTVGIWERPREAFLQALDKEFGFTAPRHHGCDTVEAIKAMHAGKCKVFFALGGNFLSATPDTAYTAEALRKCRLTVQVSTKPNRAHLITGEQALILPCLGRSEVDMQASGEQFVSTENSMGVVQMSKGILKPASEHLHSEVWIVARLAQATLGARSTVRWNDMAANYDCIRDAIERVIPGFEDYNERVRQPGGFYLPNLARDGQFETATKKANFTVHHIERTSLAPGEFVMMTIRSHDQFNTTIYGLEDRYRGIHNERRVIFLNREDMREHGLEQGQVVDLTSHFDDGGDVSRRHARHFIVVPFDIPRRCAATYYPETNVLVPIGSVAERSNTPTSKFIRITITPVDETRGSQRFDYEHVDGRVRANS
ncbi:MAG: FdhF/YdeP family oxidoreductase [Pyrinomonadaceae bacterium]|nr:FdhF/YdeP family oxidoreductase [Pyrinomonadaceae bacterium]